jgi:hypothetical protein
MIAFAAEWLMEIEVGALTGAGHGEKSAARLCSATAIAYDAARHEGLSTDLHDRAASRSFMLVLLEHRSGAHGRSPNSPSAADRIRGVMSLACDGHVATPLRPDRDLRSLQPTGRSHPPYAVARPGSGRAIDGVQPFVS